MKLCSFATADVAEHFSASWRTQSTMQSSFGGAYTAEREVLTKTLAFHCALKAQGCGFAADPTLDSDALIYESPSGDTAPSTSPSLGDIDVLPSSNVPHDSSPVCEGKIIIDRNRFQQMFIR